MIDVVLKVVLRLVQILTVLLIFVELQFHALVQLALFDLETALVDALPALGGQLDLRSRPVCQNVVGFVEQIIQTAEVPFDCYFHLIAQQDLLLS